MNDLIGSDERRRPVPAAAVGAEVRESILMVDDQPARLLTYEAILSGLGVRCVRALSGNEALERLLQQEFAAILLDVAMPGMDGIELARLIRTHPRLERTPIIFVTGVHISQLDQFRGYEVGAIDYLSVPVVPEILRSKVAVLIELFRQRLRNSVKRANHEAESRALFDHPDQAAVIVTAERDSRGKVVDLIYRDANRNAEQVLGIARERLMGQRLSVVLPERALQTIPLCAQVLESGAPARYETRIRDADLRVTIYKISEETLVISSAEVTDRRAAEAALRASESRYRTLLEHAPVGVMHAALNGRIQYANAMLCKMLGYTLEEIQQKTWQELTHPEDLAKDQALAARVLGHEMPHYSLQKRYVRKDGSPVWIELFGSFIFDERGAPAQGVGVVLDITERLRAERDLSDSQERLLLAKRAARLGTFDWDIPSDTLVGTSALTKSGVSSPRGR